MIDYRNRLFFGDCLTVLKEIPSNCIDFILTDLPYGISRRSNFKKYSALATKEVISKYKNYDLEFGEWDTKDAVDIFELAKEYYRILRTGGVALIFHDIWYATVIQEAFAQFNQPRILIWQKSNPVPVNARLNFLSNGREYMFSFVKGKKPVFNSYYHNGIFNYPSISTSKKDGHPNQKPIQLMKDLIEIYTKEGMIVLDSCMGVGTTCLAAKELKREYVGIEKDFNYYNIACSKLNN